MTKTTTRPGNTFYQGPVWSTLVVSKDGTASLDRIGLTVDEGHDRIDALTRPGCPEAFLLAPPTDRRDRGTWGTVYLIGSSAFIQVIGIAEEDAKKLAVLAVEKYGPDAPKKPDTIRRNPDGSTTRTCDMTPIVRQAHGLEMSEILQMVAFA